MERKWRNSREMKDTQPFPHFKVLKSSKTIQVLAPCDSLSLYSHLNLRRPWTSPGTVIKGEKESALPKTWERERASKPFSKPINTNESKPANIWRIADHSHKNFCEEKPSQWEIRGRKIEKSHQNSRCRRVTIGALDIYRHWTQSWKPKPKGEALGERSQIQLNSEKTTEFRGSRTDLNS